MTDQKQEKQTTKELRILKPAQDAFWAGCATSGISLALGLPVEHAWRMFIGGASLSIGLHLKRSVKLGTLDSRKNRGKRRGRTVPFNSAKGRRDIDLEYSIEQGGTLIREGYFEALKRKIRGNPRARIRPLTEQIDKPTELNEFVFYSQGLQLRQVHIDLFLKSAWRNRQYGKGLSARRWVRNFNQRPAWYKELSPAWYYATLGLLQCAGDYCQFHLVVEYENGWRSLINEPRLTMRILKWYEIESRNDLINRRQVRW